MGDAFFGPAFVDVDEWRDDPVRHRYVHGGFEGTDTLFSVYLPPPERYAGRFLQMIQGGVGGDDSTLTGPMNMGGTSVDFAFDCGAYIVESNQGHRGLDLSVDPSVMVWRARAAGGRLPHTLGPGRRGRGAEHPRRVGGGA